MSSKPFFKLLIITLGLLSCNKLAIDKTVPRCISDLIIEFEKNAICEDIEVKQYLFQNKTVYVFNSGSCAPDLQSNVVDQECNTLGALGGIAGNMEINNESFSNAEFLKTVYPTQ